MPEPGEWGKKTLFISLSRTPDLSRFKSDLLREHNYSVNCL